MNPSDPNREALEIVSERLEPRLGEFLFVGGAALGLLLTDPAARQPRASKDVDVVVRVASLASYSKELGQFLLGRGFSQDTRDDAPICRWIVRGVVVDIIPERSKILGFSNRWFPAGFATATTAMLAGRGLLLPSAPAYLAMKLEAFADPERGAGDYYGSDDIEDILTLVDGRPGLAAEVEAAETSLREFIRRVIEAHLANGDFRNAIPGHVDTGRDRIVLARLREFGGR